MRVKKALLPRRGRLFIPERYPVIHRRRRAVSIAKWLSPGPTRKTPRTRNRCRGASAGCWPGCEAQSAGAPVSRPSRSRETRRGERIALDEARRIGSMLRHTFTISSARSRARQRDLGLAQAPRARVATTHASEPEGARGGIRQSSTCPRLSASRIRRPHVSTRSAPRRAELRGELATLSRPSKGGHVDGWTSKEHFEAS